MYQRLDLSDPAGTFDVADHLHPTRDFDTTAPDEIHLQFDLAGIYASGAVWVEGDGGADGELGTVIDGEVYPVGSWISPDEE